MADVADYLTAIGVGSQVSSLTGRPADGFTAGGFSSLVLAITGTVPAVVAGEGRTARVVLTKEQASKMRQWLDAQLFSAIKRPVDQRLDIELNPVIVPWVLKYAVPVALLFMAGGWLGHYYLAR